MYDYLTNNQNDPLYPGGGASGYNDGAIIAPQFAASWALGGSNLAGFLNTYNPNPTPRTDGWSPLYFSDTGPSIEGQYNSQGDSVYCAWISLRLVQLSEAFKTAFGELNINASSTASRVRPLYQWQYGFANSTNYPLLTMNNMFGSQHPDNYYLYGGGGGWYSDDCPDGPDNYNLSLLGFNAGDGAFANCNFATPSVSGDSGGYQPNLAGSGWTLVSGTAGIAANGSSLGNPTAPINGPPITFGGDNSIGGSTQTAYLQPGAVISQSVYFSGGWADITLFAGQTMNNDDSHGLSIQITAAPLCQSRTAALYSWATRPIAGSGPIRPHSNVAAGWHTVTFTNTWGSGGATVWLDDVGARRSTTSLPRRRRSAPWTPPIRS